jgi:hypothetical protein
MKSHGTFLSYGEMPSGATISHLVYSFWKFSVAPELKQRVTHEIFPDGCFSIFYYRNEQKNFTMLGLTALTLELIRRKFSRTTFTGARGFRPPPIAPFCGRIRRILRVDRFSTKNFCRI